MLSVKKLARNQGIRSVILRICRLEIAVAAGDGKTDNDEVIEDEGALRRIRKAIADHPQGTITLFVGQPPRSVREWTGVDFE